MLELEATIDLLGFCFSTPCINFPPIIFVCFSFMLEVFFKFGCSFFAYLYSISCVCVFWTCSSRVVSFLGEPAFSLVGPPECQGLPFSSEAMAVA